MSTGKRLAKRSILGTRVVAPGDDGRLYPGIIADMKTPEGGNSSTSSTSNHIRYTVRFDENRKIQEFFEGEIIGPGFSAVTSSKLRPKQKVWVTNANREMEGYVIHHRPNIDQVIIQLVSQKSVFHCSKTSKHDMLNPILTNLIITVILRSSYIMGVTKLQ